MEGLGGLRGYVGLGGVRGVVVVCEEGLVELLEGLVEEKVGFEVERELVLLGQGLVFG